METRLYSYSFVRDFRWLSFAHALSAGSSKASALVYWSFLKIMEIEEMLWKEAEVLKFLKDFGWISKLRKFVIAVGLSIFPVYNISPNSSIC